MKTIKRTVQLAGMAITTLLLLALTVSPVAAGGKFP